jgi:fatty acid amide hydrolase 2
MMDNRFEAALLDAKYVDRVVRTRIKTEQQIAKEMPFFGVPVSIKGSIAVKGKLSLCLFSSPATSCTIELYPS